MFFPGNHPIIFEFVMTLEEEALVQFGRLSDYQYSRRVDTRKSRRHDNYITMCPWISIFYTDFNLSTVIRTKPLLSRKKSEYKRIVRDLKMS